MHAYQPRTRIKRCTLALWLGLGVSTAVLGHSLRNHVIETYLVLAVQPIGSVDLAGWVNPGDTVRLVRDAAMPEGFERVYVEIDGVRVGFLPESANRQGVRVALREGVPVQGTVTVVDSQDIARGVDVSLTIGG